MLVGGVWRLTSAYTSVPGGVAARGELDDAGVSSSTSMATLLSVPSLAPLPSPLLAPGASPAASLVETIAPPGGSGGFWGCSPSPVPLRVLNIRLVFRTGQVHRTKPLIGSRSVKLSCSEDQQYVQQRQRYRRRRKSAASSGRRNCLHQRRRGRSYSPFIYVCTVASVKFFLRRGWERISRPFFPAMETALMALLLSIVHPFLG